MLRILRPLRLISRNKGLKLSITCLINSIPNIVNLLLIVIFFIFLMAILGTTLFAGKFYRCYTDSISLSPAQQRDVIKDRWDCLNYGGEWVNPDLNFDTTGTSLLTLFTVQSTEGWIDVMWNSVDTVGQEMQPIINQNQGYVILYIILIVLICMLFLNLFVGVIMDSFNSEKEKLDLNHMLKKSERAWMQT